MQQAVVKAVEDVLCFPVLTVFPKTYSPGLKPGVSGPSFLLRKPSWIQKAKQLL